MQMTLKQLALNIAPMELKAKRKYKIKKKKKKRCNL
jgi:hypothetical protein